MDITIQSIGLILGEPPSPCPTNRVMLVASEVLTSCPSVVIAVTDITSQ
jgi:hypothetical protein